MISLLLSFFLPIAHAYHVVVMLTHPMLGGRNVRVITFYDPFYFTGYHTQAEEKTQVLGGICNSILYLHTIWDGNYVHTQHRMAEAFIKDRHIENLMKQYEEMKGKTPANSPPASQLSSVLCDIQEEEETE